MVCIFCGDFFSNYDNLVCDKCKEAFLDYKTKYWVRKKANETTELDENIFEEFIKISKMDELLEDNISGMFPESCEESIAEIMNIFEEAYGDNEWVNMQEGRREAFKKYIEEHVRRYYEEHAK